MFKIRPPEKYRILHRQWTANFVRYSCAVLFLLLLRTVSAWHKRYLLSDVTASLSTSHDTSVWDRIRNCRAGAALADRQTDTAMPARWRNELVAFLYSILGQSSARPIASTSTSDSMRNISGISASEAGARQRRRIYTRERAVYRHSPGPTAVRLAICLHPKLTADISGTVCTYQRYLNTTLKPGSIITAASMTRTAR